MKEKLKNLLNKIPFKKIVIISFGILILGLFVFIKFHTTIGLYISLLGVFIDSILIVLYTLKIIQDDIQKFLVVLLIIIWLLIIITITGQLMLKYVPKFFPGKKENIMYQLYISSFTSLLAAVVGVLGTYFGAIYGGKKSLEVVQKQIDKQEKDDLKKEKENKDMVIRIITKFLKEEIIDNKRQIENSSLYLNLNKGIKSGYTYNFSDLIKFDSYEKIKFELVKYTDVKIVEDVIDLYGLLYLLLRYHALKDLNEKEYNKLKTLENKFKEIIKYIDE